MLTEDNRTHCSLSLPMHGAGLVPAVGNVVEEVAHARILCTLLSGAEVVVHHLVYDVVRDTATTVRDPRQCSEVNEALSITVTLSTNRSNQSW